MSYINPSTLVANWPTSLVRYFFLDYDAGSDASVGYTDAAAGSTFSAGTSGPLAIKTFTKLMNIMPRNGNGRRAIVIIKNRAAGAVYLDSDGVTQSSVDWSSFYGYKLLIRRGSSDLGHDTADKLKSGFVTALTGPNGDGSFTCLAGGSTTALSVTGTPLTAEPGLIGWRVRFTGNVTAGLANVCTNILANTSSAITFGTAVTANATGDTFLIEKPGVSVLSWIDSSFSLGNNQFGNAADTDAVRDVGIMVTGTAVGSMTYQGGMKDIHGCECSSTTGTPLVIQDLSVLSLDNTWFDELNAGFTVGTGMRVAGGAAFRIARIGLAEIASFAHANNGGGLPLVTSVRTGRLFRGGSYLGKFVTFRGCGSGADGLVTTGFGDLSIGDGFTATTTKTRVNNGITLNATSAQVCGLDFQNATVAAVYMGGEPNNGQTVYFDNLTGSSGNTGHVVNTGICKRSTFVFGTIAANTASGTLGDILARTGGAVLSFAGLAITNVIDDFGNEYLGSAGRIVDSCVKVTNSSGGALAVGDIVRSNGTTGQVTSAFADAAGNALPLGVMVSSPASAAVGYMATTGSPKVTFDGTPTIGAIAYLSVTTTRLGTTTIPAVAATNQKIRLGRVVSTVTTTGRLVWQPEIIPVLADGLA